jgi:N-acetylmuramic acid 6-phosphate etherase
LTGPEVLTGSTRLKAGTATKLVLNQITTISMVQLGKCYENLMVDLRATNQKLWDRGARIIMALTALDRDSAMELLKQAEGHVKAAIVMNRMGVELEEAQRLLDRAGGRLREAITPASS